MSTDSKNYGWYAILVFLLLLAGGIGILYLLSVTGVIDNPFDDDNGYGGSGLSEEEWFDGPLEWTNYTNPDDPTGYPIITLPNDDFDSIGSAYYGDLNYSNVTDFGGFQVEEGVDDDGVIEDSARTMIIIYADLDESPADEDDLLELIDDTLEISSDFTVHADSPMLFTVDGHGQQSAILREGTDPSGEVYAMLAYMYWNCDESDRTYTMVYGVAKNLTCNEWSDDAFYQECEDVFSQVVCHA